MLVLTSSPRCLVDFYVAIFWTTVVPGFMQDLLILLSNYGGAGGGSPSSDITSDGTVNVEDLLGLLAAYGQQTSCGTFSRGSMPPYTLCSG